MARIFIIKAAKGKMDFFMTEPTDFLYFYSRTLKDLRGTLRCITAKGYRVPKEATISKRMKSYNGHLTLLNPFFQTTMFEIFEIDNLLKIKREVEYENSFGFKHNLKIVDSEITENILKHFS
ncbi:MAG: hypothetical protein ABI441_03775 [Flavobacterium sp.]